MKSADYPYKWPLICSLFFAVMASAQTPDLTVSLSHSPDRFVAGQTATYTIIVSNTGNAASSAENVIVADVLPVGVQPTSVAGDGWNCSFSSAVTNCNRSEVLPPGRSYPPITITVSITHDVKHITMNTVTVTGAGGLNVHSASNVASLSGPDLTISKSHTGDFHQGQSQASYTLTVTNVGDAPTSGTVTVSDAVPTGMTVVSASGFSWACSVTSTAAISCTRNDALGAGSSYPVITLVVSVANDAPATLTNTATVSGGGDVNPANNSGSDSTTIDPSPDLTIAKSHTPDPFVVGQSGTYTLTVSNVGHAPTSGTVTVTDALPAGLSATAITGTGWTCAAVPTINVNCSRSDALAAGSSYTSITVTVSVTGGGPQVTNQAMVSGGGDFNSSNNTVSDVTNVNGPILSITKSHVGNFTVGQSGTYTITVSNVGPVATLATEVDVHDTLPSGMLAASIAGTGWSCFGIMFIDCTRSEALAPGSSYPPINLTVNVGGGVDGPVVSNTASVTGGGDLTTHTVSDPTNVKLPDLQVFITHSGTFVAGQSGGTVTFTITNVGTISTAGGLPQLNGGFVTGAQANGIIPNGWSCPVAFPGFVCERDVGVLTPGSSLPPITMNVTVFSGFTTITAEAQMGAIAVANPAHTKATDVIAVTGFTIVPTNTSATVTAGTSANFMLTLSLGGNPGTVTFSASGLPANSKATFNPPSVTASATVTMTIDTSGNGHTAALQPPAGFDKLNIYLGCVVAALTLWGIGARRRGKLRIFWLATSISVLGFVLLLIGCGGGGGSTPPPPPPPPVTPSGTYTITVTGASSTTGVPSVSVPVTLVVK